MASPSKKSRPLSREIKTVARNISITDHVVTTRPDDAAYQKSRKLWLTVPRGCADIVVIDNDTLIWKGFLRGLPKFGYKEDLSQYQFDHDEKDVAYQVFVTKENGECLHFSCSPKLPQGRIIVFGSKNVHAAVIMEKDDDFYTKPEWMEKARQVDYKADRFGFAFALVGQMVAELRSDPQQQGYWTDFLDTIANQTAIAEACNPERMEHLVKYHRPTIRWLGWRPSDGPGFFVQDPLFMRKKLMSFGFQVPDEVRKVSVANDEKSVIDFCHAVSYFQNRHNCEGAVVYTVLKDGRTVSMYKEKNFDYIRRRAVREKVKQGASTRALTARIRDLHVPYCPGFLEESLEFNAWVQIRRQTEPDLNVENHYMDLEKQFQNVPLEERERLLERWNTEGDDTKLIFIVGAPCQGSGKTRLANVLTYILSASGIPTERISQDDCGGNRRNFLQKINHAAKNKNLKALVIDKYNNAENRRDYRQIQSRQMFVGFHHPEGLDSMIQSCVERIQVRGNGHLSLRPDDKTDLKAILESFAKKWTFPTEDEGFHAQISLSVTDTIFEQIRAVLDEAARAHLLDSEIKVSDAVILQGLEEHKAYETRCSRQSIVKKVGIMERPTLYWKIELEPEPIRQLWTFLKMLPEFVLQPSFHVTLVYFQNKVDKDLDDRWKQQEGKTMEVTASRLVWSDRCAALLVDPALERVDHPHITVAKLPGVPSVEARTLTSPWYLNTFPDKIIMLDAPMTLEGTIQRVQRS